MRIDSVNVHILIGLPACGKSTFAKKLKNSEPRADIVSENDSQVIRMSILRDRPTRFQPLPQESMLKVIDQRLDYYPSTLILDGLFLETDLILTVLRSIAAKRTIKNIVLDYWPEDREACLRNDYRRRSIGSALSIQNLSIHVDFDAIKKEFPNTVVKRHATYRIPDYMLFFRDCSEYEDGKYLRSAPWSLGGTQWNFTGDQYPVDAEEQPARFEKLDLLIREMFPAMTHVDSQIIYQHCVTVETKEDSDYYSRITQAFFQCDLEKLYEMAAEMGYLDQDFFSEEEKQLLDDILRKDAEDLTCEKRLIKKLYLSAGRQVEDFEEEIY